MISSIESGLEYFFKDVDNPFQCPLPSYVITATCSMYNTGAQQTITVVKTSSSFCCVLLH